MNKKLRIVCPVALICLVVLVFSIIGLRSNRAPSETAVEEDRSAVTYTADAWNDDGMAGPAMAQETAAVLAENTMGLGRSDKVPPQEHRDSGYVLNDSERMTVERIVMCESGGEGERGQMMVAQCILEGMLRYNYSIDEYINYYHVMLTSYSNVTDEVRNSVSRVFDNGERVVEEKADLWYNPALTPSAWHEEQQYVITIGSHRFFWMEDDEDT